MHPGPAEDWSVLKHPTINEERKLTDIANLGCFNQIMCEYFSEPYPARAAIQVAGLPKGGLVEADAILVKLPD